MKRIGSICLSFCYVLATNGFAADQPSGKANARSPDIKPRGTATAAIAALAYRPDGKMLVVGGRGEVLLLDAAGDLLGKLPGQLASVTAVTFSRDGQSLAVASGAPGKTGEVRLYAIPATGIPAANPALMLAAHKDIIYDLAFSPDSKLLASCGYDRVIKLWNVATGAEVRALKDHSDTIYGVTFSPDGKLLASAAADRAVKIWDVATGTRLYTLGESTDWLYALAWSPDGRHVAAGGVDKSIRIWEATPAGGKIVQSAFAHEKPITRLAYAADGKTLYSLSEDRAVKAWDAARLVESKVYAKQPETTLSLAVRPDQKQLALGRYDGVVVLLDAASGQVLSQPVPVPPKPPQLQKLSPSFGPRGKPIVVTLEGKFMDSVTELTAVPSGVLVKILPEGKTPNAVQAELTFPATTPAGVYALSVKNPAGLSTALPFTVDPFPTLAEKEPNDSPRTGQSVTLPVSLLGTLGKAGEVDYFRFEATASQQIGVQALTAVVGSKLEPILQLTDDQGRILVESASGVLGFTCPRAGTYALGIRDKDFRGGADMHYRLHVGNLPVVTNVFPLGLQRGSAADILLEGVHLGPTPTVHLKAGEAALGTRLPVAFSTALGTPLGAPSVLVGEFPEVSRQGATPDLIPVPGTANGRIAQPGATETWRFQAKKGQRLILEVNAQRLGSPLDSYLEILDAKDQPVPVATLRGLVKIYSTFRDHDSASTGVRIETWTELAINDYMLFGNELLRIRALPRNPDDNCEFFSVAGQRLGYLGTTPIHHPNGEPMYKVALHRPGTTFPPNGLPVVTLYYRNDDGGPGFGKDSQLFFDPPGDGEYRVRIGDSRGFGGNDHAYRFTVRPPRPSFNVSFTPTAPTVSKGGAIPVTVSAERIDGYDGPIDVHFENLPAGFNAPPTRIQPADISTAFALYADPTAQNPTSTTPLKLVAKAAIQGQEITREVVGTQPKVTEPGDLATTTEQAEIALHPGQQVQVTAKIERRNAFAGRVPLDVRGLPHGVRVLDVGLNGILVTERDTSRTFVIYCEPWVQPLTQPFVVLARSEKKGTEHAAKSVILKIVAK